LRSQISIEILVYLAVILVAVGGALAMVSGVDFPGVPARGASFVIEDAATLGRPFHLENVSAGGPYYGTYKRI
jgi:uncharacterized protein (UPF0333 family)